MVAQSQATHQHQQQRALLALIADGEWHSGEDLGAAFNVSRAAVWKQLQQLQAAGLSLESERGKGYRLSYPVQLLDAECIRGNLSAAAKALLSGLDIPFIIDSTNTRAMQLIEGNQASGENCSGRAIFAEQQTAGRGRRGRNWVSPLASNIYCSLIWRFASGAAALSGLSLAVGVATVQALESLGYKGVELKWPNDLLWQGRKLGGILLEMSGDAAGPCDIVVGIGINVSMSQFVDKASRDQDHYSHTVTDPAAIDQAWVDLLEAASAADISLNKNAIVSAMLNQLLPMLASFEQQGFSGSKAEWIKRDAFIGRDIVLQLGDKQLAGQYQGVDSDGALLINTSDGQQRFNGGEVSLRAS